MFVADTIRVEMQTNRDELDFARRAMNERNRGEPLHERVSAIGQMIAGTLTHPSTNFESELYAAARRAHYLLWLQTGEEIFETHNYVIVHVRDNVLQVGSFETEEEFFDAQESHHDAVWPRPTSH